MPNQYVTLVTSGGTPVRIANQRGTPIPTTGTGALVFANEPVLNNPTLVGVTYEGPQTIDGDLIVTDDLTVGDNLTVTDDLTVGGTLSVAELVVENDLEVPRDLTVGRHLIMEGSTSGSTIFTASAVANGTLTFPAATDTMVGRATTDTLTNKTISAFSNTLTGVAVNVGTFAALQAISQAAPPPVVITSGYLTANDGGGGPPWVWTAGSAAVVDNFLVAACASAAPGRYIRSFTGAVSPKWAGCGLGAADDSVQFAKVVAAGYAIDASNGTYRVLNISITSATTCPRIFSDGSGNFVPTAASTTTDHVFSITKNDFAVDRLTFTLPISTSPGVRPTCDRAVYFSGAAVERASVTNCYFIGGRFGPYFAGTPKYIYCNNNRITQTYGQGISADSPYIIQINDNEIYTGGYDPTDSSGAIRIGGIGSQANVIYDCVISRNIIKDWNVAFNQEAIDLSAQACRNLLVDGNVIDGCGNGGIELKTGTSVLVPNVFQNVLITNNVIRMLTAAGVGITLHFANTAAPSKESKITVSNNRIYSDAAAASGIGMYGISITALEDVFVTGNDIQNIVYGILVSPNNTPSPNTASRVVISNNNVMAVDNALSLSGSGGSPVIDDLLVQDNRLVSTTLRAFSATVPVVNRAIIQGNFIQAQASDAMELRGLNSSKVVNNTVIATGVCVLTQSTPVPDLLEISDNNFTSSGSNACNIGAGTNISILRNRVTVPIGFRTVIGAGTYVSVGNIRGTAVANPSATTAGALNDIFLNSSLAVGGIMGWVCTVAGGASAATYVNFGTVGITTNMATFLGTPSSANLLAAVSDETGTGALVFANTPTLVTPVLGAATGTSVVLTGGVTVGTAAALVTTSAALNDGAAAQAGTLANAPSAGNPTKWVPINDNGTTRYIPTWT